MITYLYDNNKEVKVEFSPKGKIKTIEELEKILKKDSFIKLKRARVKKIESLIIVGKTDEETLFLVCQKEKDNDVQEIYADKFPLNYEKDLIRLMHLYLKAFPQITIN